MKKIYPLFLVLCFLIIFVESKAQTCSIGNMEDNTYTCSGSGVYLFTLQAKGNLQWQVGDDSLGTFTDITGATDSTYSYNPYTTAKYFRLIASGDNCADTSTSFKVAIVPTVSAKYSYKVVGKTVTFTPATDTGYIYIHWDFGDGTSDTVLNPVHTYPKDSIYEACFSAENSYFCFAIYCNADILGTTSVGSPGYKMNTLTILPNPCSTCQIKGIINEQDITITDMLGRKINAALSKTSDGYTTTLPGSPGGIYVVRNTRTGEVVKFMKE